MTEKLTPTLSLKAAYVFGAAHGLKTEIDEIRDMEIEWDLSYSSSLRRGYIVALFEQHGLFDEFKTQHWPFGNTTKGEYFRRHFLRVKERYEDFLAGRAPEQAEQAPDLVPPGSQEALEFALEAHLRDFLARNPALIEPGLHLHESPEGRGVEYPVENGRIDLLAVDRDSKFVVVELKLSRGRNKTLGQVLYYMGWVDKHLGNGPCRGVIIASEITDDLTVAVSRAPGVRLAKYRMNFSIEAVS